MLKLLAMVRLLVPPICTRASCNVTAPEPNELLLVARTVVPITEVPPE